jgi:hypothetical protein
VAVAATLPLAGCAGLAADQARPQVRRVAVATAAVTSLCAGRPAAPMAAALARAVPGSRREEFVPFGLAASGLTGFGSVWAPGFAGVAAISLRTGALRPVMRFRDPAADQADGVLGGRWLVWEQTHSLQSLDGFTVYGWDSATGRLVRLGQSLTSPDGTPWPSPWHPPAVSGDFAAWAQGYGPRGLVQIRLADLRTGRVTVIARGHLQAPFFDAGLLVWPQSARPGTLTTLRAYSLRTGTLVPLPPALRPIAGTDVVATDGTRTAYLNPALTGLYYSANRDRRARLVLRLPAGDEFTALAMGPGALAWTTTAATFVASTRTGRYTQVTPAYGFAVTGRGPAVLVADAPTAKGPHPSLALHVVDARRDLPAAPCTG